MDKELSLRQVAKKLGVRAEDIKTLEKQGILHRLYTSGAAMFSAEEIERINTNHGLTITQEATQFSNRMTQSVFATFSFVTKLLRVLSLSTLSVISFLILLVIGIAISFKVYPDQTAQFFGFYYTYNVNYNKPVFVPEKPSTESAKKVLGLSTEATQNQVPPPEEIKTTFVAKLLKPVASVSLLIVRATDNEQYQQIVTVPAGLPGLPGSDGGAGQAGQGGQQGPTGATGPAGVQGVAGIDGAAGLPGAQGPSGRDASGGIEVVAGSGLSGGGTINLGSSGSLSINAPVCNQDQRLTWNGINFTCASVLGTTVVSANEFFAGPLAGAADQASFRAITAADIGSGTADQNTVLLGNQSWLTLLDGGKIESGLLPDSVTSGLKFQGSWNASTNSPALSSGASTAGNFYIVGVAGTTEIDGESSWSVGDWIVNSGSVWERVPSTSAVSSVNGETGAISLTTDDVSQGTVNKYFSNTLARNAIGGAGPISYVAATGNIDCPSCVVTTGNGALVATGGLSLSGSTTNRLIGAGDVSIVLSDTAVSPGSYGSTTTIPVFTVNAKGQITAASGLDIADTEVAGDITGTLGATSVEKINGAVLGLTTATSGNMLIGSGTSWVTRGMSGDATLSSTGALTLKNTGTAGTYGTATAIPVLITDAQGRVTSVTNTAISGLTATNLTAGDYSTKINSGTYTIDVAGTSTNFSGSLAGDVTGTQGVTLVAKINGAVLGSTTATSGNMLIGSGTSWVTRGMSGDATLSSTGGLTLKNTGTAGTYGTATAIPVLITDAQGRVTSVTNTAISGLTATNLTAGDYSTKINSGTYTIDVAGTATNFSGSLAGDVTGTQGVTLVEKINGATLGSTTATSGNILVGNGSSWITRAISGDATIDATGALTLNYVAGQSADATHKGFLTSADWNTFNSKQAALGYTPEDGTNKSTATVLGTSDILYPTQNAVKTYVDNLSTGLNWQSPVESINVVGDASSPIGSPANNDAYIIITGGATGAWSTFAEGDVVQYQVNQWVKVKSLIVGDRFGVAFTSDTTPSGSMAGKKNYRAQVTGGTAGEFTYTFTAPANNQALYNSNSNDTYHNFSFTYSSTLAQWVQFAATTSYTFANGLSESGSVISLGPLTSDWDQTGAYAITTAGNVNVNGGTLATSALTADLFNTNATTLNLGGAATTINLGAAGVNVVGGGAMTIKSGSGTALTVDSGTTGALNIGTSANAKTITIGSGTSGTTIALTGGSVWSINAAGNVTTTGDISTTGSGTITSAGLLTASNGVTVTTGPVTLTGTSGAITLSGLSASSISTGANNLIFTSGNFRTTATGINSTAIGATTPSTAAFTTLSASGQVTSTVSTGTAPFVIASTTNVANLNASFVNGLTFSSPGAIGGGTAAAGAFTTLTAATSITNSGLTTAGVVTNTAAGLLGTVAGTSSTVLHGNASGLPTFGAVTGSDLATDLTLSTTGNISSTGTGTITSAGLLTASNGLTLSSGALNLTAASGAISISGLTTSSITTAATNDFSVSTGTTGALTLDSGTTGNINIGTNANAKTITIGNGTGATSVVLNSGTGNIDIGQNAVAHTIRIGNATGATAVNTTSGTGGIALLTTASGALSLTTGTTGTVTLDSGTTGGISIGTNANAKTIAIGNATGATAVNTTSGTGGISLLTTTTGNLSLTTGTTGAVTLDSGTTGNVNIGTNANAKTITIGNATGATAVNTTSGTGGIALLTTTTGAVSIDSGTTGNITIGTNANAKTITIGNATGATAVNTTSGTGGIALLTTTTGNLSLTTGTTGAVTLDSGTTGNVNIGTNANAKTITIGNSTGATAVNTTSGTGGIALLTTTTGNLSLRSGTTGTVTLDSGTTGAVSIGTNANAKSISIGNTTGATSLTLSAGTGGVFGNGFLAAANGNVQVCINNATKRIYQGGSNTNCNTSSARYKDEIATLDDTKGLDLVRQLRPVSYVYKNSTVHALGFIAEEINELDTRPVVYDELGRPNALDYDQFVPILTKGLQELDARVTELGFAVDKQKAVAESSTLELISTQIADAVKKWSSSVIEFVSNVTFRADVFFAGRPTFNNDTAGFAKLTKGAREVRINFEKEYATEPIIVASPDSSTLYAVVETSTKGFKIQLDQPSEVDIRFSWTATAVQDARTSMSEIVNESSVVVSSSPVLSPEPSPTASSTPAPSTLPESPASSETGPEVSPVPEVSPSPSITPVATSSAAVVDIQ